MTAPLQMQGQLFGKLRVIERAPNSAAGKARWFCQCVCDKKTIVVLGASLLNGKTVSCGCQRRASKKTHGKVMTIEYSSWKAMIARCTNPHNVRYPNYGGRGIKICERWRSSFAAFYKDLGNRPSRQHSLGRIDNDGDYTPDNCRWETARQQQNNMRSNVLYDYKGQPHSMAQLVEISGLKPMTIWSRIQRGIPVAEAVEHPLLRTEHPNESFTVNGVTRTAKVWRKHLGLSGALVYYRLHAGWSLERAVTTPPDSRRGQAVRP
jgi:hypothetical protein